MATLMKEDIWPLPHDTASRTLTYEEMEAGVEVVHSLLKKVSELKAQNEETQKQLLKLQEENEKMRKDLQEETEKMRKDLNKSARATLDLSLIHI